ncbi:uncharacterized protein [Lepisosteus oculatus]|uniref:uncharacterized protein n=1 Tax=Lepisosteus oculatus TaxID=7918 RepID=UPI0035F5109A
MSLVSAHDQSGGPTSSAFNRACLRTWRPLSLLGGFQQTAGAGVLGCSGYWAARSERCLWGGVSLEFLSSPEVDPGSPAALWSGNEDSITGQGETAPLPLACCPARLCLYEALTCTCHLSCLLCAISPVPVIYPVCSALSHLYCHLSCLLCVSAVLSSVLSALCLICPVCSVSQLYCHLPCLLCVSSVLSSVLSALRCLTCTVICPVCSVSHLYCHLPCLLCVSSVLSSVLSALCCLTCTVICPVCSVSHLYCHLSCLLCVSSVLSALCLTCTLIHPICSVPQLYCHLSCLLCLRCTVICPVCSVSQLYCHLSCLFCVSAVLSSVLSVLCLSSESLAAPRALLPGAQFG